MEDFSSRVNEGHPPSLMTADEYGPYRKYLLEVYGAEVRPGPPGKPGRPKKPYKVAPPDLLFARVHKTREKGKVVEVDLHLGFGTQKALEEALKNSAVSKSVNLAFIERYNGTDRHFNARKARKTYEFSKNGEDHVHQSWLSISYHNFCWDQRRLRIKREAGRDLHRSPAMAAKIPDHIWTREELATFQLRAPENLQMRRGHQATALTIAKGGEYAWRDSTRFRGKSQGKRKRGGMGGAVEARFLLRGAVPCGCWQNVLLAMNKGHAHQFVHRTERQTIVCTEPGKCASFALRKVLHDLPVLPEK